MYDTIVIGNDLSSLVAAAVISHHGKKTALLSESDAEHVYSDFGYTFNVNPLPLTGFGPSQICSRLLEDLGIPAAAYSELRLLNPGLQIILSDHRVDCFHGREELLHDMEREFPDYADAVRKLYSSVLKISNLVEQRMIEKLRIHPANFNEFLSFLKGIPVILAEAHSLSRRFKSIAKNSSLTRVFEAERAILSDSSDNLNGIFAASSAYALSLPLRGLYHHVGGNEALVGLLKSAFQASGGHLIKNSSVLRINMGKEIDLDISVPETASTQVRARYLIVSTKWEKLRSLLLGGQKFRRMEQKLKLVRPAYYPFTLHMGVLERCIPERMATYVAVIIDQNRPVMDDNVVFVEISDRDCKERAPVGKRALSATIFLKDNPLALTNDDLKDISQVVFCALEKFLPFLRESLDFLNIGTSIELARKCQELVNQKYIMRPDSFFGIPGISNRTPLRNVFMTGGMLRPGFGFEGEIISGLNAANLVVAKERKRHG
jgi:phytoene dehydrogenase-like protein